MTIIFYFDSGWTGVPRRQLRERERPEHAVADHRAPPPPSSSPPSSPSADAGAADGALARRSQARAAAHPARAIRGRRSRGGLRGMRPQDIRQILPSGGRQAVARRVPPVLALPSGSRQRGHVLQPWREHLLQEGLLSVSERLELELIALSMREKLSCDVRGEKNLIIEAKLTREISAIGFFTR